MCLILFAYRLHSQRPLVLAANRDEFYAREALSAQWWKSSGDTGLFGGRDVEAGGTWLAVARDGRLAAVTNWTEDRDAPKPPGSRGDLARGFLRGDASAGDYVSMIDAKRYAGFNFIAYDGQDLVYMSNRTGEVRVLGPAVYGLTNTRLGPGTVRGRRLRDPNHAHAALVEWPKAVFGAAALEKVAATATTDDLIGLLAAPHVPLETPADRELAPERSYSPCFIHGAEYGTRASTAIIVGTDSIEFVEQQYGPFGKPGGRSEATFSLPPVAARRSEGVDRRSDYPARRTAWT